MTRKQAEKIVLHGVQGMLSEVVKKSKLKTKHVSSLQKGALGRAAELLTDVLMAFEFRNTQ